MREEAKEVKDKIPILGDLPLLGRLFRSHGETTQKKNLLIFVTAHVLSADGTPLKNPVPGTFTPEELEKLPVQSSTPTATTELPAFSSKSKKQLYRH
jgi:type II secretory pathway component GspD/PulD (secretin)